MIVCCNKIDEKTMNYSKDRYEEIKTELTAFLKKIGYKTEAIPFSYFWIQWRQYD